MSLPLAIKLLETELSDFGHGTVSASGRPLHKEGTPGWFVIRAKLVGLSMLKQMQADGCTTPAECQLRYKYCSRAVTNGQDNAK